MGYENIFKMPNPLETLKMRRHIEYINYFAKLFNHEVDDSFLLCQINFNVNIHNIRNNQFFIFLIFPK